MSAKSSLVALVMVLVATGSLVAGCGCEG